jgi:hypothetical protein
MGAPDRMFALVTCWAPQFGAPTSKLIGEPKDRSPTYRLILIDGTFLRIEFRRHRPSLDQFCAAGFNAADYTYLTPDRN